MTLIPYKMYFSDRDFVKVQIIVAQGKRCTTNVKTSRKRHET